MSNPQPEPTVARLTTSAQMVASLPLYLGYTPTESFVVACCHEPRGRIGLTMRYDLPPADHVEEFVADVVRRVRRQEPTRLLLAVYTEERDEILRARAALVEQLLVEFCDLRISEAVLVRGGRFWSYLCEDPACCPPAGTPVDAGLADEPVRLLAAEQVLRGQVTLRDRDALEDSLAGPTGEAEEVGAQHCTEAILALEAAWTQGGRQSGQQGGRQGLREVHADLWDAVVTRYAEPPAALTDAEAAQLAVSLVDRPLRDAIVAGYDPEELLPLLAELCRRTPEAFAAPVCTAFAWVAYIDGGGAAVTVALERALRSDPDYSLALLLSQLVDSQVDPQTVRRLTREASPRAARRRAPRSRRSRGSAS